MKIAIIGAGLIGCERIVAIQQIQQLHPEIDLISVFDPNIDQLKKIEQKFNVKTTANIDFIFKNNPDWIFICTPHNTIKHLIKKSFDAKSNVLVEKPLGRNLEECNKILSFKPDNLRLNVGFNYRFFAGVESLLKDCRDNKFGKLISVNMILGHGNSPGMEKSWKLDPIQCGGGCLIDPGVHLLDLILNISSGVLNVHHNHIWKGFWNTGIEEESHILMSDSNSTIFNTQISINKWRSTFRIEVNGTEGYGIVEGRGRSYGPQSYRTGVRWGWQSGCSQQKSESLIINSDICEDSFKKELLEILFPSIKSINPCNEIEASNVMMLLNKIKEVNCA